jgi:glycosyltransferase involved in cell wall biosynthesis
MGEKLALKSAELGLQNHMEILEPTTDVAAEYQNASIYAMSSKFEGFPMTLLEAMASGVPCVSFACPNGPSEMIKDGEDGYLVQPGDVAALADRLGGLADDAALRARMGAAARENIKRYDIVMITKHWDDVLGEIAQ